MLVTLALSDGRAAMGDNEEIQRLHAVLEQLAAEVARLHERLDEDQAARDDALRRAISGLEKPPWSPGLQVLCGGGEVAGAVAGAALANTAALVALTVTTGTAAAAVIGEHLARATSRAPDGRG